MGTGETTYNKIFLDAEKIPFEGPEARFFKNVIISDDNSQPFRHCKTMRDFLQKVNEIKIMRKIGYGITADKMDWFLYAPSNELYKNVECIPWRMQEEQTMRLMCLGKGDVKCELNQTEIVLGIFGSDIKIAKELKSNWKKYKLSDQKEHEAKLYNDIIQAKIVSELSVFFYITRDIRVNEMQRKYGPQYLATAGNTMTINERILLEKVVRSWDFGGLVKHDIPNKKLDMKKGTKFISRTTDTGGLNTKMIMPGPWSSASCHLLGHMDHSDSSNAMIKMLLGDNPLSKACKRQIKDIALYLAKGGDLPKSQLESSIPFRDMNDWQRPGAPIYPKPEEIMVRRNSDMFHFLCKHSIFEKKYASIKLLSKQKQSHRKNIRLAKKIAIKQRNNNYTTTYENIKLTVKLSTLPPKIPHFIRRYPIEIADFRSPYKSTHENLKLNCGNRYSGYVGRVARSMKGNINFAFEIPTLNCVEDDVTCIDTLTNKPDLTSLISRYVEKRTYDDPHYKGILNTRSFENLDAWGAPCNCEDTVLSSEWNNALRNWSR